jgi:catechol 2,3-dioxygenase-like lactoylglutathione lyase family enzyme
VPVNVRRLAWLGTRTERFEETTAFFRDVLGLSLNHEAPGFAMFRLPDADNDYVEVFAHDYPEFSFFTTGLVVGLLVDDLAEARAEIEAAGAELIDDPRWPEATRLPEGPGGYGWFHVRAPDGNVYAFVQGSALLRD